MIEINNLVKSYGEVKALNNLNLKINKGEFVGLLGPNGAGKTTLIRLMIGLIESDQILKIWSPLRFLFLRHDIKSKIGVVAQHINLDKELSVWENLYFSGLLYKVDKKSLKDKVDNLLELMDLTKVKDRLCKKLSGGMKRKLMIAKAIIHEPDIIFIDEPTVGIDVNSRRDIWNILKKRHRDGKTILLTTHYIEEAQALCDQVGLMNEGQIHHWDTPDKLIYNLGKYTVEYLDENNETKYVHFKDRTKAQDFTVNLESTYSVRPSTLEDVFFSFANRKVI